MEKMFQTTNQQNGSMFSSEKDNIFDGGFPDRRVAS